MRDLAATGRMTDMDGVLEVELPHQLLHVLDIGVHVVAGVGLRRAAMAAAVVRHDSKAVVEKEHQLRIPVIGAERPAMVKDDRPRVLRTPVLVEDIGAVAGGDEGHEESLPRENAGRQDRCWVSSGGVDARCYERALKRINSVAKRLRP